VQIVFYFVQLLSMPINFAELNLVLCGPILRKVTSHSVAVFVALKAQRYIELTLHDGTATNSNIIYRHSELNQDFSSTVPLGKHLHVALVQLDLAGTPGLFPGHWSELRGQRPFVRVFPLV